MNTLQGAAVTSATQNGAAAPAIAQAATQSAADAIVPQDQQGVAVTQLLEGMGKNVVTTKRSAIDEDSYHLAALEAEIETRQLARDM
jgi:hypothetical protein